MRFSPRLNSFPAASVVVRPCFVATGTGSSQGSSKRHKVGDGEKDDSSMEPDAPVRRKLTAEQRHFKPIWRFLQARHWKTIRGGRIAADFLYTHHTDVTSARSVKKMELERGSDYFGSQEEVIDYVETTAGLREDYLKHLKEDRHREGKI